MRPIAATTAFLLAGSLALPAFAQSKGERLDTLEARMDGVERQLANQGLMELSRQIEQLTVELRKLRA
jgi:hypothetical protein